MHAACATLRRCYAVPEETGPSQTRDAPCALAAQSLRLPDALFHAYRVSLGTARLTLGSAVQGMGTSLALSLARVTSGAGLATVPACLPLYSLLCW